MNNGILSNKTVIITGTRRGIGRSMLETFAENGANIWAHARKETTDFLSLIDDVSKKYDVTIRPLCFELTNQDEMKLAVKKIMSSRIPVDGLVNNAGVTHNALFQMTNIETVRKQFETNYFAVYTFTQYISKLMIRQHYGSIVNIASTAGIDGNAGKSAYGSSKAAVISMTKSIAEELGVNGIRANCIAPGITETEMLNDLSDEVIQNIKNTADLRRAGKPIDIANTAVFLISDLSSYITGQVIRVDGGM